MGRPPQSTSTDGPQWTSTGGLRRLASMEGFRRRLLQSSTEGHYCWCLAFTLRVWSIEDGVAHAISKDDMHGSDVTVRLLCSLPVVLDVYWSRE